jgi:2-amino-4-hydroxy-6-hydroxymethyldihydropteridine diphosphokinase
MKNSTYLSLGSNLGDRLGALQIAIRKLGQGGVKIEKCSSAYETAPQDFENQPNFLNCVLLLTTDLDAHQLLDLCWHVEDEIGRKRTVPFGPRSVDIDILTFNGEEISTPSLIIPHPRMCRRNFVLTPLKEITPNWQMGGQLIDELLQKCADQRVKRVARMA